MGRPAFFTPAKRNNAHVKVAISGASGSGKSTAAIQLALGLGSRVAVLDTEGGASQMLDHLGNFDVSVFRPPFVVGGYLEGIEAAVAGGYDVLVIDGLSQAWHELLGQKAALDARPNANGFGNWKTINADYQALVRGILDAPIHVVFTLRSKTAHVQVVENGRPVVKRLGLQPEFRDGIDYEVGVMFDLSRETYCATVVKDRTSLFSSECWHQPITKEAGRAISAWLEGASSPAKAKKPCPEGQWLRGIVSAEEMEGIKQRCAEKGEDWKRVARAAMKRGAQDLAAILVLIDGQ